MNIRQRIFFNDFRERVSRGFQFFGFLFVNPFIFQQFVYGFGMQQACGSGRKRLDQRVGRQQGIGAHHQFLCQFPGKPDLLQQAGRAQAFGPLQFG